MFDTAHNPEKTPENEPTPPETEAAHPELQFVDEELHEIQDALNSQHVESEAREELEADIRALQEAFEAENLTITEEEAQQILQELPNLLSEIEPGVLSPEFIQYWQALSTDLQAVHEEVAALSENKDYEGAMTKLADFLEDQQQKIETIPDENLKNYLLSYIHEALKLQEFQEEANHHTRLQLVSLGIDLIPVIGSGKMLVEAAKGRDVTGEKVSRVKHGAEAMAFLVLDGIVVMGLFTGGAGSVAAEGGKVAARGGVKLLSQAPKAAEAGKIITRFAALCRKTKKFEKISKSIFRIGMLARNNPRVLGAILKFADARKIRRRKSAKEKFKMVLKTPESSGSLI